jgi:PAS domain S-box-containing protein
MLLSLAVGLVVSKMTVSGSLSAEYVWVCWALAGVAGLVGFWSIVQYVFGLAPSIETVLYHDLVVRESGSYPGRPSPHTAVTSLLVGLLVGLSPLSDPKLQRLALVIGIAGFVMAWLALFGYATLTGPVYSVAGDPQTGMSLIGSLGFLALVIGSFGLRPDQGFVGLLRSQSSGGLIVRLLLPAAIVTPLIFGWLAVYEARSGILETSVLVALNWGITSLLLAGLVLWGGFILDNRDRQITRAQQEVDRFFSLSPDLLCIASIDGHFQRLNPAIEQTSGYTAEELLGRSLLDLVYPDDAGNVIAQIERLASGEPVIDFASRYVRKDGAIRWLSWSAIPVLEEGMVYAAARDITERMQEQLFREHSTPVLPVHEGLLIMPIIGVIDNQRAQQLTDQLLSSVRSNRAKVAVIDVTGVPTMDLVVANHIMQTVRAVRLMGAKVIITGLSAEVARTLVTLGIDFSEIDAKGDLRGGIEEANTLLGYRLVKAGV